MYLSNIKLWNFRKYGRAGQESTLDLRNPHLSLDFSNGLNVLIGENDSGKSAIIDAIKLTLKTQSYEWLRIEREDFFNDSAKLRIELEFDGFKDIEAKNFTKWLGWKEKTTETGSKEKVPYLRLVYEVQRKLEEGRILPSDVRAGVDDECYLLDAGAKEYLKVTYLKPLRDAESDLTPKRNSRLSQILASHEAFKGKETTHFLVRLFERFNDSILGYFEGVDVGTDGSEAPSQDQEGKKLKDKVDSLLSEMYDESKESNFDVTSKKEVKEILEKLELSLKNDLNPGLGTLNRLFVSSELLHLEKKDWTGLRLGLIEELEAHLHPQAQMRIIAALREISGTQLILTTHSPNIGSKVKLKELILCSGDNVFPMKDGCTRLKSPDYTFLERFLDATKANLFFAKGVILVEGWAEEILIPALAKAIDCDLTKKGVSVVNVGNLAFLRYSSIFQRQAPPPMEMPVAVVTDLDIMPEDEGADAESKTTTKKAKYDGVPVKTFVSPHWTLEYCIARSTKLRRTFYKAILEALREKKEDEGMSETGLAEYVTAITNIDVHFNGWSKSEAEIASSIYSQILGEAKVLELARGKISKTIIAQHFAKLLDEGAVAKTDIETDTNISYLIDAIKYACRVSSH
ncbi:MAG: AAA family ATPase [Bacteroidota bacterium]|nr:AAA family ATPase [Bacteroidota bacterium]MDP4233420.1 AAA family ATPase [Bacteroidota bacterium]MDP4242286.1 AAA family ATPase [Bacteroidota bacterium]MDP4287042.1 AAA family ATPase [Bacteroidota bacterium]